MVRLPTLIRRLLIHRRGIMRQAQRLHLGQVTHWERYGGVEGGVGTAGGAAATLMST